MIEGQEGLSWERWRHLCSDVEALGFASLRRSDHLVFLMVKERIDLLEAGVATIKDTWSKSNPKPPRAGTVPILMGGVGEKRHLPLVAREASEWNYTRMDHDEYRHKREVINASCKEI